MTDIEKGVTALMDNIRSAFVWVYNWITVLVGVVAGALAFLPDVLDLLIGVNLTDFGLAPTKAAAITSSVALAKAIMALVQGAGRRRRI